MDITITKLTVPAVSRNGRIYAEAGSTSTRSGGDGGNQGVIATHNRLHSVTDPLDHAPAAAADYGKIVGSNATTGAIEFVEKPEGKRDRDMVGREPPYTASIDRAIALLERSFRSGLYRIEKVSGSTVVDATRVFWATAGAPGSQEDAYAPTAPLAILLALFKALQAQDAE